MEKLKSILVSLIVFGIFSVAVYWAFSSIESGSSHIDGEYQKELEDENESLKKEVSELKKQIDSFSKTKEVNTPVESKPEVSAVTETPKVETTKTPVLKYQSLIDELQKIYNDKVIMEKGAKGTRVGSVQKFLNIYNKTSNRIDNDFGVSMVSAVTKFQKDTGITADGGVGPSTILKMIDWLKKQ